MDETLLEYASDERITLLLAKERAKLCKHRKGKNNPLLTLMPSRADWEKQLYVPEQFRKTPIKGGKKRMLYLKHYRGIVAAVKRDIEKYDKGEANKRLLYVPNLKTFCEEIREVIASKEVTFHKPTLLPVLKKEYTYRPLSVYTDIKDKVIIGLLTGYLTKELDPLLHENILSYRPKRKFRGRNEITTSETGVRLIKEYQRDHQQNIFVADCDIRNFYDTISHYVIRKVVAEAMQTMAFSKEVVAQVECIVEAYLDSYNFLENVLEPSRDKVNHPLFWHQVMKSREQKDVCKGKVSIPPYQFAWVEEELTNIYGDEWDVVKNHIGIPQGGALSLFFANIVLNDVDKPVLAAGDDKMFFCRYCDDMVLMHTDKKSCQNLIENYSLSLTEHKLIPHNGTSVSSCKNGIKTTKEFWNIKSHDTFLWGSGPGDASHWVGFLGYEMNNIGETRMRYSSLEKHKSRIKLYSYSIIRALKKRESAEEEIKPILDRIENCLNHYVERMERSRIICKRANADGTSWERQRDEIKRCVESQKTYISKWIRRHPHLPLKPEDVEKICFFLAK